MDGFMCAGSAPSMEAIEKFRTFLNSAWPALAQVLDGHDWDDDIYFVEDWLDANWQLLVGRQLLAQASGLQPFSVATNEVLRRQFSYWFESTLGSKIFVSLGSRQRTFEIAPPFDHVMVLNEDGSTEIVQWLSLEFELKQRVPMTEPSSLTGSS